MVVISLYNNMKKHYYNLYNLDMLSRVIFNNITSDGIVDFDTIKPIFIKKFNNNCDKLYKSMINNDIDNFIEELNKYSSKKILNYYLLCIKDDLNNFIKNNIDKLDFNKHKYLNKSFISIQELEETLLYINNRFLNKIYHNLINSNCDKLIEINEVFLNIKNKNIIKKLISKDFEELLLNYIKDIINNNSINENDIKILNNKYLDKKMFMNIINNIKVNINNIDIIYNIIYNSSYRNEYKNIFINKDKIKDNLNNGSILIKDLMNT